MAIKFSQFNERTDHTSGMYLVGYDGNQNIHITVDNLFDDFINGTENTITMFGTDGTVLTDSILSQDAGATILTVSGQLNVDAAATFDTSITVTGDSTLNGNVTLGNAGADLITQTGTLYLNGPVKDTTDTLGVVDQVLLSDAAGELTFTDLADLHVGGAEVVELPVKNVQGSALVKGDPVYISGSVGASGRLEVQLADASNTLKMPAVGLLKQDLANNAQGFVVVTGKLRNLITDPIDGVNPTENDVIYIKPSGASGAALTTTKPVYGNFIQNIGKVGRVSTSNDGNFVVSSILRTNDIPNLTPGRLWVGSTGNTIESQTLFVDEATGRLGVGVDAPYSELHVRSDGNPLATVESYQSTGGNLQAAIVSVRAEETSTNTVSRGTITIHGPNSVNTTGANNFAIKNHTNGGQVVVVTKNSSGATKFPARFKPDGDIQFDEYGSGVFTGTGAYNLSVDSSGNIIETAAVPANIVETITTTDGTYINLTPNSATDGDVTITADLSAVDGASDATTKFLSKDNTWDVPFYTTVTTTDGTFIDLTPNAATSGAVTVTADLSATGAPDATKYLRGDNTWSAISGIYSWDISDGTNNETIINGDTVTFSGDTYITTTYTAGNNTLSIDHDDTSRTDTASADSPGYGGTFTVVDSVSTNATGHLEAINVKTVTMPSADDTNTTYDLSGYGTNNGTAGVQLVGSDSSTDQVAITGAGTTSVTHSGNTITVTSNDQYTGTVTGSGTASISGGQIPYWDATTNITGTSQLNYSTVSGGTIGVVGIGNSSTSFGNSRLVVGSGSGGSLVTLYGGNNSINTIAFANGTSGNAQYRGQVRYNLQNDNLEFITSGNTFSRVYVDSASDLNLVERALNFRNSFPNAVGAYVDLPTNNQLSIGTNGSERMRIDSSGNVLINRTGTSGLGKLNVEGGADFTGGNVLLCRDTGAVGIGTSSPDALLDIGVNNIITLDDTGSSTGFIGMGSYNDGTKNRAQGTSYYGFGLEIDRPNQNISFNSYDSNGALTAGTNILVLKRTGNVGIGTSSPINGKLQIDSTGNQISIETGTSGDGRLHIGHFSNGTFIGTYGDDGGAADIIRFGTHSGDERMRINSAGNVGIGTTNPSGNKFQVNQTSDQQGIALSASFRGSSKVEWEMSGANNEGHTFLHDNGTNRYSMWYSRRGQQSFYTENTERLRIGSAGQIGIGGANYGTSGQVLTSSGSGSAPSWQTPTTGGITGVTAGSYMTGGGTSGTVTLNANASTSATANTLAARDGAGDITARLFRATYGNQSTISGAIAFRVNNSSDTYTRYCSNPTAIRTFIGAGTSSFSGSYNDLSNKPTIPTNYLRDDAFDSGIGLYLQGGSFNAGTDTVTAPLVIDEEDFIYTKDGGYLRKLIGKTGDQIQIGQGGTSLITSINFLPGTAGNSAVKINSNTVWNAGNDGAGSGLDADLLDGLHATASGNRWGVVPTVGSSGVLEAGKYIDFHESDSHTGDYNYRITSSGGRLYLSGDLEVDGGDIYINDSNTHLKEGSGNSLKVQTNSGYVEVGAQNASYAHFTTDRGAFYFSKEVQVNTGIIRSYDEDLNLTRAGSSTARLRVTSGTTYSDQNLTISSTEAKIKLTATSSNPSNIIQATHPDGSASPPLGELRWDNNPGATGMRLIYYSGYNENSLKLDGSNFVVKTGGSTRMLINSSGNVGIGTTNPSSAKLQVESTTSTTSSGIVRIKSLTASSGPFVRVIDFVRSNNSTRGYVAMNPYSVQYNSTSDYRLKRNVTPMENSIDRIKLLKPSRFNWVEGPDDYVVDGFIAHEVQDVVHEAVSGEKDAVDKNNEPSYQGIDQSKLVPLLTAALQDAITKIENLETRIQTLENN